MSQPHLNLAKEGGFITSRNSISAKLMAILGHEMVYAVGPQIEGSNASLSQKYSIDAEILGAIASGGPFLPAPDGRSHLKAGNFGNSQI